MSEKSKSNILLPLGIGAGLLLLLTSIKKNGLQPVAMSDEANSLIPQVNAGEAKVPQIDPAPAPSYAQAKATSIEYNEEDGGDERTSNTQQSEDDPEDGDPDEESDDGNIYESSGSRGGGSGTYAPYRPSSSINTNQQTTPVPVYRPGQQIQPANMQVSRAIVNNKSLRFQSDQAKKFAQRSVARYTNPLIIGNGKPRMGTQLPIPSGNVTAAIAQQPIIITSQHSAAIPVATTSPTKPAIFPLRFGTTSAYVKEVQRKLGVSATGYFGTMTKSAIQKRFGVSEISEVLYKQIITGKTSGAVHTIRKPVSKIVRKANKPITKKYKVIKR